jgi:hypothetical protein
MRKLLAAGMAAMTLLGVGATAASAKPAKTYSYTATIDCGAGPRTVGSTDNLFAPLVDLDSRKVYLPVAWDVVVDGRSIQAVKPGKRPKHAVDCSYDDGVAVGTVTVRRA